MEKEYWITNGPGSTAYDMKEEIKAHGGRWNTEHKAWSIIVDNNSSVLSLFKNLGLSFQLRRIIYK